MSLSISSKLTENGISGIYEKLFNSEVSINRTFFNYNGTLLKLRLYSTSSDYIESVEESYEIINHSIIFTYKFSNAITYNIISVKLYNGSVLMMEINNLDINSYCTFDANENSVILKFTLEEVTQCITNSGYTNILRSLVNEINDKITNIYIGVGNSDLSGESDSLTEEVNNYDIFTNLRYFIIKDNTARVAIKINNDDLTIEDITELGLGTSDSVFMIQPVNFSKINYSDNFIIEVLIKII